MADPQFCTRLLQWIVNLICEKIPETVMDEAHSERGFQVFQPHPVPDHPAFDEIKDLHVYDIVCSRQMHSENHTPTCFKYNKKECRLRYPRGLVQTTAMDPATGVISLERDHRWLNAYNPWLSLMIRANHDVQILLTKDHVLAAIFYILKYICKPEETLHSKLTIAAAHRKAFSSTSPSNTPNGRRMILQIYNKIESHREIGVPEAISHLLRYPDHYTTMTFEIINTTQLWLYVTRIQDAYNRTDNIDHSHLRSQIIPGPRGYTLLSPFDDYRLRGPSLADYCLYDYRVTIYKRKLCGGVQFSVDHPQHGTHSQFCRETANITPCLTGSLFHLSSNSTDANVRQKFFSILVALFIPWYNQIPLKQTAVSWEDHFQAQLPGLSPRIRRYIFNIDLLHKSKEESCFDQMQREARYGGTSMDDFDPMQNSEDEDEGDNSDEGFVPLPLAETIEDALMLSLGSVDFYAHEAIDAGHQSGFFDAQMSAIIPDNFPILPKVAAAHAFKLLNTDQTPLSSLSQHDLLLLEVLPAVFISDLDSLRHDVSLVADAFTLNVEQRRAFHLIAYHTLRWTALPERLLMGVFGEGGTGKTQVIRAVRAWFTRLNKANELLVTATTGTAAVNIDGRTVHNATGIGIEVGDVTRTSKVTDRMKDLWETCMYMVIDEVSMLSCQTMVSLNAQLMKIKNHPTVTFGGVNLIFFGDFLQFPAVSRLDLYMDRPRSEYALGHNLWRSLNAAVILRQQMRQAKDPDYAALLQRVRYRIPSEDDIVRLNERVCAPLSDLWNTPVIIRRHSLRQVINRKRVQQASTVSGVPITYCVANISQRKGISLHAAYNICAGEGKSKGDGILCLLPGTPLMITDNIKVSHREFPFVYFLFQLTYKL
jgi:hypothetical protein